MSVWKRLGRVVQSIYLNPRLLKDSSAVHERSFEDLLCQEGILSSQSSGYKHHPNGPNKWPDFHIYDHHDILPIELKSTSSKIVHMGDTWIKSHGLYVISYKPSHVIRPAVMISFGNDLKTEKDDEYFHNYHCELTKLRNKYKPKSSIDSSIKLYPRSSTRYMIQEENSKKNYDNVMEYLKYR